MNTTKFQEIIQATINAAVWVGEDVQKDYDLAVIRWAIDNNVNVHEAVSRPAFYLPKDVLDGLNARAIELKEKGLS